MKLHELTSKLKGKRTRLGRGPGTGLGKTCGRGQKGQGARSGYKRRYGFEGGGVPLYMKIPTRGFSRAKFRKELHQVNLGQIDKMFEDGDIVTLETLRGAGFISGKSHGVKLLAHGELTKTVSFELKGYSKTAIEKLDAAKIKYKTI